MDIVCHMITSLDGCILLERWSKPAERVDFTQVYEATAKRLQGDGWIVGRITMAEYGQGVVEGEPAGMRRGEYAGRRQSTQQRTLSRSMHSLRLCGDGMKRSFYGTI